jgi:hypothetical protein
MKHTSSPPPDVAATIWSDDPGEFEFPDQGEAPLSAVKTFNDVLDENLGSAPTGLLAANGADYRVLRRRLPRQLVHGLVERGLAPSMAPSCPCCPEPFLAPSRTAVGLQPTG